MAPCKKDTNFHIVASSRAIRSQYIKESTCYAEQEYRPFFRRFFHPPILGGIGGQLLFLNLNPSRTAACSFLLCPKGEQGYHCLSDTVVPSTESLPKYDTRQKMQYVKLNNNLKMPIIGMGTYPLNGMPLLKAVVHAYRSGYTSFDTSAAYFNEQWLGYSIRLLRILGAKSLFITTKLSNSSQRNGDIREGLKESMNKLGVKKVDLYLMHWPYPGAYLDSWMKMEELYREGLVGAIGVCNFHQHHLDKLLEVAEITPSVNQVELHPLLSQEPLRKYCKERKIQMQAYSPIARMDPKLINHPVLMEMAKKYEKTVPQIVLKWDVQKGIVSAPKSGNKGRLKENIDIFDFDLTEHELSLIDAMNEDYRVRFDPDTVDYINVLKA